MAKLTCVRFSSVSKPFAPSVEKSWGESTIERFHSLNRKSSFIREYEAIQTVGEPLTAILARETAWGAVSMDMHCNVEALPRQTPRAS